jgi:hypothetical protein
LIIRTELRNRIYTFASSPLAGERCCVVPSLALAQTCRQIRSEYRAICLKTHVTIDWKDVPLYLETFFPTRDGRIPNIGLAPTGMTIFTNAYRKSSAAMSQVDIDFLPILRMSLMSETFRCDFMYDPRLSVLVEATDLNEDRRRMIKADADTIGEVLSHRHYDWLWDVAMGRVHKLMILHIGTEDYPNARFFIGPDKENTIPSELLQINQKEFSSHSGISLHNSEIISISSQISGYVRRIELREALSKNGYGFRWEVIWAWPEQRRERKPSSWFLS